MSKSTSIGLLIFIAGFMLQIFSSKHLSAQKSKSGNNITAGISVGPASFFGDLSENDYNPVKKLRKDSGPMFELYLGKRFNLFIELDLSLSSGRTVGEKQDANAKFLGKFNIFSVSTAVSMAELLFSDRATDLDYGIVAGASLAQFRSVSYQMSNDMLLTSNGLDEDGKKSGDVNSGTNLTLGYYVLYPLNPKWALQLRQTFEFLTTDNFDSFIGSTGISDRLLLTRLGIKYTIGPTITRKKINVLYPGTYE